MAENKIPKSKEFLSHSDDSKLSEDDGVRVEFSGSAASSAKDEQKVPEGSEQSGIKVPIKMRQSPTKSDDTLSSKSQDLKSSDKVPDHGTGTKSASGTPTIENKTKDKSSDGTKVPGTESDRRSDKVGTKVPANKVDKSSDSDPTKTGTKVPSDCNNKSSNTSGTKVPTCLTTDGSDKVPDSGTVP